MKFKYQSHMIFLASTILFTASSAFCQNASNSFFDNIPNGQTRHIEVALKARSGPIELAKGGLDINISSENYTITANYKSSGLAAAVSKSNGAASTRGIIENESLRPRAFVNQESTGRKRKTTITYRGNALAENIEPAYGSMGNPVTTDAQKQNTVDPVTGLLELALITAKDRNQPCGATVQIYDGKRRYDINTQFVRIENTSTPAYTGAVAYCRGSYNEIAGFKSKEPNESRRINLELWLANINNSGVSVPVRIRGSKGIVSATIYADKIVVR